MGKKSLLKSTSKKKSAKTKPETKKELKSKATASSKKKATEKPAAEKPTKAKSTATKTKPAKTTSKATKAKAAGAAAKPAPPKKAPTQKELLKKSFDRVPPAQLYSPPAAPVSATPSPPFVSGTDPAEADRVRKLLFKSFDLSIPDPEPEPEASAAEAPAPEPEPAAPAAEAPAPEPEPVAPAPMPEPEPETPPPPVAELLKKTFDRVTPAQLYSPPAAPASATPSPPFVSGTDPAEADRVRKLLFKSFDLSIPDPEPEPEPEAPAAEAPAPEPEPAAPAPEAPAPEPEPVEPAAEAPTPEPEVVKPKPAAPQPPPKPIEPKKPMDPMLKTLISAGSCLAAVFFLIIVASISNVNKYYVVQKDDAVEIFQGRFAPMGTECIATLTGATISIPEKTFYSRDEVGPLIVDNYLHRADAILTVPGTPDLEDAQDLLNQALPFASTSDIGANVQSRLNRIEMALLVLKADIKAAGGTPEGFEAATALLKKASRLAKQDSDKQMIQAKLTAIANHQVPPATVVTAPQPAPPAAEKTQAPPAAGKTPAPAAPAAKTAPAHGTPAPAGGTPAAAPAGTPAAQPAGHS